MKVKQLQNILKTIFSLGLGVIIIWLLYRKTNIGELWDIAKSANFGIIGFSLLFGLLGNYVRALRWELLINSLGYTPKRLSVVSAVFGNYAVNFLLPRAGDLWRCGMVTKYDGIPIGKTFETFLIDKIIDILVSVVMVVVSIAFSIDFFVEYFHHNPGFSENLIKLFSSTWLYLLLLTLTGVVILLFTRFKENKIIRKIIQIVKSFKNDILLISQMKSKMRLFIYTVIVWLSFFLYFYICFYAFGFTRDLGAIIGWIVFTMSNVGLAVPVQGGVGTWHFMVISSLVIFGVGYDEAGAFAGAVFTIQSIWIILLGVIGILALPHIKRDIIYKE